MKPHYVLCILCLYMFSLFVVEAQLTQSLGWGSAGSPGKRSRSLSQDACEYNTDVLQDILYLIQVSLAIFNYLTRVCTSPARTIRAHEGLIPTRDISPFFSSDTQHLGQNLLDTDTQNSARHSTFYLQKP